MVGSPLRILFAADPKETTGVLSKSVAQLSKSAAQLSRVGRRKATVDTASPQCSAGESGRFPPPPSLPPSLSPSLHLSLTSSLSQSPCKSPHFYFTADPKETSGHFKSAT